MASTSLFFPSALSSLTRFLLLALLKLYTTSLSRNGQLKQQWQQTTAGLACHSRNQGKIMESELREALNLTLTGWDYLIKRCF